MPAMAFGWRARWPARCAAYIVLHLSGVATPGSLVIHDYAIVY